MMKTIKNKILFKTLPAAVLIASFSFSSAIHAADTEFSYNGDNGPAYWFELNPEWSACAGTAQDARQSPVDIDHAKIDQKLKPLDLQTYPTTIDIFNNNHTIEQRYEATGSSIYFEGRGYELQQFHFHTLSEHAIEGDRGSMELHAVFEEPGGGDNLVISMLFEVSRQNNSFIQTLIDAGLPRKNGDTTMTNESINLADVLTSTASYYTYSGSLTTPPCSEKVTWIVLQKPAKFSQAQFESFRRILGNDFRPLQALNSRTIRATRNNLSHKYDKDD